MKILITVSESGEDRTRPILPHAVSKEVTASYVSTCQMSCSMKSLAFRFLNVHGPDQAPDHDCAAVNLQLFDKALGGRTGEVDAVGGQFRGFTCVDTLGQVVGQAVLRQVSSPDSVNLAYGSDTTMLELLDQIEPPLGGPVARLHTASRSGNARASRADNIGVTTLCPDIVPFPLREGLAANADWSRGACAEKRSP